MSKLSAAKTPAQRLARQLDEDDARVAITAVKRHAQNPISLSELARLWLARKKSEDTSRDARILIEEQILNLIPGPAEGTVREDDNGYSVKVVRKLIRTLDYDVYMSLQNQIPTHLDPVYTKYALDPKRLRAIEAANPALYNSLCVKFITVKPAKATVSIEEVEK